MILLVAVACLGWIALFAIAFVYFMGTGAYAGWIFAGALTLALAAWVGFISWEIRNAVGQPKASDSRENGGGDFQSPPKTRPARPRTAVTDLQVYGVAANYWDNPSWHRRNNLATEFRIRRTKRPRRSVAQ